MTRLKTHYPENNILLNKNHYYDPDYELNLSWSGALVCLKEHYFIPMSELYTSYRFCPFCGQYLKKGNFFTKIINKIKLKIHGDFNLK